MFPQLWFIPLLNFTLPLITIERLMGNYPHSQCKRQRGIGLGRRIQLKLKEGRMAFFRQGVWCNLILVGNGGQIVLVGNGGQIVDAKSVGKCGK
jgi:hypothetical protein